MALFSPGEHLTIPSRYGARLCLERAWSQIAGAGAIQVKSRGIFLPYSLSYTAARFGLSLLARWLPNWLEFSLPVGALEAVASLTPEITARHSD